jgi:hypothetical protein
MSPADLRLQFRDEVLDHNQVAAIERHASARHEDESLVTKTVAMPPLPISRSIV